jgi:predicted DNA-binding protein (UPF0251 family)
MPRPVKPRWISFDPPNISFMPQAAIGSPAGGVILTIDELEALRLADLEGQSQEEAARSMNISRATFGRIVAQARRKVADALVFGKAIGFEGGAVRFNPPYGQIHRQRRRGRHGRGHGAWR